MVKICTIDSCERPSDTRGLCKTHKARARRGASLDAPVRKYTPPGAPLKFVAEVAMHHHSDECLPWPFARGGTGYGIVNVMGRPMIASRYVCREAHGPPPNEDYEAAHSCNAGHLGCVNPHHLMWKTREQNVQDKRDAGTLARGPQMPHSKLTEDDVRAIRRGHPDRSMAKLAKDFGVCECTVNNIIHRRRWAWVDT